MYTIPQASTNILAPVGSSAGAKGAGVALSLSLGVGCGGSSCSQIPRLFPGSAPISPSNDCSHSAQMLLWYWAAFVPFKWASPWKWQPLPQGGAVSWSKWVWSGYLIEAGTCVGTVAENQLASCTVSTCPLCPVLGVGKHVCTPPELSLGFPQLSCQFLWVLNQPRVLVFLVLDFRAGVTIYGSNSSLPSRIFTHVISLLFWVPSQRHRSQPSYLILCVSFLHPWLPIRFQWKLFHM